MSDHSAEKSLEDIRREYAGQSLLEDAVAGDPITQFKRWFREARQAKIPDVNAMTLATANSDGRPSARVVLLKGVEPDGFRFYTNYGGRKSTELAENPWAALCFYWQPLERQVRVEGQIRKLPKEISARYFAKRPRQSQLGAWASHQSTKVESRQSLEKDFEQIKKRFEEQEVPLPEFWGGYLLKPQKIEFWQGRPRRLHDRILYEKSNETSWITNRLAP